jgi:hypothetical protein
MKVWYWFLVYNNTQHIKLNFESVFL